MVAIAAAALVAAASLAITAQPAGATFNVPFCAAPLAPVWALPGTSFVTVSGSSQPGCARIFCPPGYRPDSPYANGAGAVFYSVAWAIYQTTQAPGSLVGCRPNNGTTVNPVVTSVAPWTVESMLCWYLKVPRYQWAWRWR